MTLCFAKLQKLGLDSFSPRKGKGRAGELGEAPRTRADSFDRPKPEAPARGQSESCRSRQRPGRSMNLMGSRPANEFAAAGAANVGVLSVFL